jgi:hypothetical protein
MTKLKKHNGTKHPSVQPVNETENKSDHSSQHNPQGGHPLSQGGSRQGNIGHDYTSSEGANRQVQE